MRGNQGDAGEDGGEVNEEAAASSSPSSHRPVLSPVTTNIPLADFPSPPSGTHAASTTRSELDFDVTDPATPVGKASAVMPAGDAAESSAPAPAIASPEEQKQHAPQTSLDDDAPPTPSKDYASPQASPRGSPRRSPSFSASAAAPAVPQKDQQPSPRSSSFTGGSGANRPWSPSLSGSLSRTSSISLSRQASISNASAALGNGIAGIAGDGGRTTPESPPSALPARSSATRPITRKRMSLSYVQSPSSTSGSAAGAASPLASMSTSRMRPFGLAAASDGGAFSPVATPRSELGNPFTTSAAATASPAREDGQTVMDLSKSLLAEIAQRERRVGELKTELKNEEAALKTLQSTWQNSVARELAAENVPSATTTAAAMARLRAPRQKPGVGSVANSSTTAAATPVDANKPAAKTTTQPARGEDTAAVPVGVTDALRGFSAKLPSGWGGQLNTLLDNLNTQAGESAGGSAASGGPAARSGLDSLAEAEEPQSKAAASKQQSSSATTNANANGKPPATAAASAGARTSLESSATSPSSSSSSRGSKRSSSLFGSFSVLREQFEESLRSDGGSGGSAGVTAVSGMDGLPAGLVVTGDDKDAGSNVNVAAVEAGNPPTSTSASTSSSWSSWSKRLKDAAARAEKALGDAMAIPEESEGEAQAQAAPRRNSRSGEGSTVHRRRSSTDKASSGAAAAAAASSLAVSKSPPPKPSSSRRGSHVSATANGSAHSSAATPYSTENAREKNALAELELGWLSNLMTGGGAPRDGDKPKQLTAAELMALQDGDGLVPSAATTQRPPLNKANSASKRTSMAAANANNFFGMLSSAWGGEKLSEQFEPARAQTQSPSRSTSASGSRSTSPNPTAASHGRRNSKTRIAAQLAANGASAGSDSTSAATTVPGPVKRRSFTSSTTPTTATSNMQSRLQQRLRDAAGEKEKPQAQPTTTTTAAAAAPAWDWTATASDEDSQQPPSALSPPLKATPRRPSDGSQSKSPTASAASQQAEEGDEWGW